MTLRILHVYKDYPPVMGGIEYHIRALAEAQAALGHAVTVLVTGAGRRSTIDVENGVRVVRAGRWATVSSTPLSWDLGYQLARQRPDVTHLHAPYPVGEAAWLVAGRRPMVLSYHSDIVRQRLLGALWSPGLRLVLARAARVIAGSPTYADTSPYLRRVRAKVTVVPYGIRTERVAGGDPRAARALYGAGPNLVFIGRLRYYKGLHVLIDALAELDSVDLLVVGTGGMGDALKAQAAERGVAARVRWLGDVPDDQLATVLAAGDLFVLPATHRSEAFGIVQLEAMAAGLPVVSTELGTGTSWVNQDGLTGRVVAPGDPGALAAAIRGLLADPETRRRMGIAAQARVAAEFTEARMVERVLAVYAAVTGGGDEPARAFESSPGSMRDE